MAVIRVIKTKDYTVMSNAHLKNTEMSLKAKGLLSVMLSLPDNWDYSIAGLVALSNDGKDSVMTALSELEKFGHLKRTRLTDKKGRFSGYDYEVYEIPNADNPYSQNPNSEKPNTENQPQLNTNKLNTNKSNIKELNTKEQCVKSTDEKNKKIKYAEFVSMTDDEYSKLINQYGKDMTARMIEILDNYKGQSGKTYKSDYRAILNWVVERAKEEQNRKGNNSYGRNDTHQQNISSANAGEFKPSTGFRK